MPVAEFAGNATVLIRDGQGTQKSAFALPFSDGRVAAKPKRPKGPAIRTLVDGRRKERRADGWYMDVTLEYDELSIEAHRTLVQCIDTLHQRADADTVHFCPESPVPSGAETDDYLWEVVPALKKGDVDLIYENRVRERSASLILKARREVPVLPDWFE